MRRIKIAAVGAGNRMNAYTKYAELHPEEMEVVAVVEPNEWRRQQYAGRFHLPPERCFTSWEAFFEKPQMADAVFLCTPDYLHYEPACRALEKGYDILLEKPIARSWQECAGLVENARRRHRIIGVCHVLRYHPYFKKIKEIIDSGTLGEMISMNHVEAVGIERMTHAFVRGLWRKEEETNPMILSKACHDLDLLVWLSGRKCVEVSSYGSLKWFRPENAPLGSTLRCTDGCAVEGDCPYSALNLYYRQRRWLRHFDLSEEEDEGEAILRELRRGPYGKCAFRCDNDVVDHQVVAMLMEGDVTVNFSMEGFTKEGNRRTHITFSGGEIEGDEKILTVRYFAASRPDEVFDFSAYAGECSFHGGADLNIVADFIRAVRTHDHSGLLTRIDSSLESHRIAFEIERERRKTSTEKFGEKKKWNLQ